MEVANNSTAWQHLALNCSTEVSCCLGRLVEALEPLGYGERDLFGIRLALEEALVNAVKHGHRNDRSKTVRIRYQANAAEFLVEVEDEGPGFDPDGVPDPLAPENLERPGGRGVFLMRHYMTWVSFNERGNLVTMCRRRSP
jgi:serine/threonine-protein kinase RsbW